MNRLVCLLVIGVLATCSRGTAAPTSDAVRLVLKKGDRVVFIGNTFADRMIDFGNFEAMLVARFPELELTFRGLGWSGDELTRVQLRLPPNPYFRGEHMNHLQPRPLNFGDMDTHLTKQKADVIFACFGMNESFRGAAGVEPFKSDTRALVLRLREHQYNGHSPPRVVLVSPIPYEQVSPLLPDPGPRNADLAAYTEAMREIAAEENVPFVDLYHPLLPLVGDPAANRLTFNGIHLTAYGYWVAAQMMLDQLGFLDTPRIEIDAETLELLSRGPRVAEARRQGKTIAFEINDWKPAIAPPPGARLHEAVLSMQPKLVIHGLKPGRYTLAISGKALATADAAAWRQGIPLLAGPAQDAGARLRRIVVEKNRQFFYRWRAVNGEYIYGRRKNPFGVVNFPDEMHQLDEIVAGLDRKIHAAAQPLQTLRGAVSPTAPK